MTKGLQLSTISHAIAALSLALVLTSQNPSLAAESATVTGNVSRDRISKGAAQFVGAGIGQGVVLYKKAQELKRAAAQTNTSALALELKQYEVKAAQTGVQEQIWNTVSLTQKTLFTMGGPVGVAAAGVWTGLVDTAVADAYKQTYDGYQTALRAGLSKIEKAQLDRLLKENNPDGPEAKKFRDLTDSLLKESSSADERKRTEIVRASLDILLKRGDAEARKLYDVSRKQRVQSQQLARATERVVSIDDAQKALEAHVSELDAATTRMGASLNQLSFDQLPDEASRAAFIRKGGLSHVDGTKVQTMLETYELRARFDVVSEGLATTQAGLGALAGINRVLGNDPKAAAAIGQVQKGVQYAQVALAVFAAFTPAGSAMAAFQALGGLGGGGGGPDYGPQLAKIQQTLNDIDKKIDKILSRLDSMDRKLDSLQTDVAELKMQAKEGFAQLQEDIFSKAFDHCRNALSEYWWNEYTYLLPFQNGNTYQTIQYRLGWDVGDGARVNAAQCAKEMGDLLNDANRLKLMSRSNDDQQQLDRVSEQYSVLKRAYETYVDRAVTKRTAGIAQQDLRTKLKTQSERSATVALANPATTLTQLRQRHAGPWLLNGAEDKLPCWWRSRAPNTPIPTGVKCQFARMSSTNADNVTRFFNERTREINGRLQSGLYLHPRHTLQIADLTLAFAPALFFPANFPKSPADMSAFLSAFDANSRDVEKSRHVTRLMIEAVRITERALARESLLAGDLLAAAIAADLLEPPFVPDPAPVSAGVAPPLSAEASGDYRITWSCLKKWALEPSGVTAPLSALLYDNPRLAQLTLRLIVHHLAFDTLPAKKDKHSLMYEFQRQREPDGRDMRRLYGEGSESRNTGARTFGIAALGPATGSDSSVIKWWEDVYDLKEKTAKMGQESLTWVGRGFQLHYAQNDGEEVVLKVAVKADPSQPGEACAGYSVVDIKAKLPRGWSVSAGGAIVGLSPMSELMGSEASLTTFGNALRERRNHLIDELAALVVRPQLSASRAGWDLASSQQAQQSVQQGPVALPANSKDNTK